ncbi:MAG TPA: serine hydrolase domain-containing protein [Caulobacteraceae bacterium]|nr:serine hydrolase domain-containing protein [Caulobacteraceae bacterium]
MAVAQAIEGAAIEAALSAATVSGLPGVAAAARLADGTTLERAAGMRGLDNPQPMTPDTVFWIASFTKALTTTAVLQLVERGQVGLDDPVGRWLPALAAPKVLAGFDADGAPRLVDAQGPVTVRQLLTHRSGLAYDFCHAECARYSAATSAARGRGAPPLMFQPGAAWTYGVGLDSAGELVTAVTGKTLDVHLAKEVFAPLGMSQTGFAPTPDQAGRRASMHARGEDGTLAATPFQLPPPPNPMMGGGGLYSTAGDYLKFLSAILAGGAPILSAETVAAMQRTEWEGPEVGVLPGVNSALCAGFDPFPGETKRWGLGFLINPRPGPNGRTAGSLAWAGLANCYYWADPAAGVAGVFLAQLLPFGDPAALEAFAAFERAVYSR